MIKWTKQLPQNQDYYLWSCITDPHSQDIDVVFVGKLSNYRTQEDRDFVRNNHPNPFVFKNDDGEELVICWNRIMPAINPKTGLPEVDGWALFDFP